MFEKLKVLVDMDYDEMVELKQALLAYDLGFEEPENMTLEEIERVEKAFDFYYENDDLTYFIDERIVDAYNDMEEQKWQKVQQIKK